MRLAVLLLFVFSNFAFTQDNVVESQDETVVAKTFPPAPSKDNIDVPIPLIEWKGPTKHDSGPCRVFTRHNRDKSVYIEVAPQNAQGNYNHGLTLRKFPLPTGYKGEDSNPVYDEKVTYDGFVLRFEVRPNRSDEFTVYETTIDSNLRSPKELTIRNYKKTDSKNAKEIERITCGVAVG